MRWMESCAAVRKLLETQDSSSNLSEEAHWRIVIALLPGEGVYHPLSHILMSDGPKIQLFREFFTS